MPTLIREDNVHFVIHPYREQLIIPQRASVLKSKIRQLAQHHGDYVRLIQQSSSQLEAIFSRDPGFLLGETVWTHFGKPDNLIYCEALPSTSQAIVVVVRLGSVYLDTKMPISSIPDELNSLITSQQPYDIYLSGDLPIAEKKTAKKFSFDHSLIKSFTHLEGPLFPVLSVRQELQLQPLEVALRQAEFSKNKWVWLTILLTAVTILVWILTPYTPTPRTQTSSHPAVSSEQLTYEQALMTPSPQDQLTKLAQTIQLCYTLPGWQAKKIQTYGDRLTIEVVSLGASLRTIAHWADAHHIQWQIMGNSVELTQTSGFTKRPKPQKPVSLETSVVTLIDRLQRMLPYESVELGQPVRHDQLRQVLLNVALKNASPGILMLVGEQLKDLPLKLNSTQLSLVDGLLTGTIQLTILGK